MLDLQSILWIIPGSLFIYLYNNWRPLVAIKLSGWPLISVLTVIAAFTWLPAELTSQKIFELLKKWDYIEPLVILFSKIMSNAEPSDIQKIKTLFVAVVLTGVPLLLVQFKYVARIILPTVNDNFYRKCMDWENQAIILTLKNGKAYIGILWKYPESPRSRYESQTISIIPIQSGYRDTEKKQVQWTTRYLDSKDPTMETIIPRQEILTFGKFNETLHEWFEDLKLHGR